MLDGNMWALPVTQGLLVGTSMFIAIPSLMVFLSLVLQAGYQSLGQHPFWRVLFGCNALHDDGGPDLGVLHFLGFH